MFADGLGEPVVGQGGTESFARLTAESSCGVLADFANQQIGVGAGAYSRRDTEDSGVVQNLGATLCAEW